nr:hypothetical protein [uncultured Psychroserpens sp.]
MNKLKLSTLTALVFFSIGTLLLLLHVVFRNQFDVTIIGLYYVLFAIVINSIIVVILLIDLILNNTKVEALKSIGVILLNAPIALLYFHIVVDYLL